MKKPQVQLKAAKGYTVGLVAAPYLGVVFDTEGGSQGAALHVDEVGRFTEMLLEGAAQIRSKQASQTEPQNTHTHPLMADAMTVYSGRTATEAIVLFRVGGSILSFAVETVAVHQALKQIEDNSKLRPSSKTN